MSGTHNPRNRGKLPKLFATAFPETFFRRSCLPRELLMHVAMGHSFVSREFLNKMCQKNSRETHFTANGMLDDILVAIRNECAILRKSKKYTQCAKKVVDWIGPVHWKTVLEINNREGMGVCPGCNTLIFKNGGCDHMICGCGQAFWWYEHKLDAHLFAFACSLAARPDAMILRKRILRLADRCVCYARSVTQRRSKRPLLKIIEEETMLTIEDIGFDDEDEGEDANTRMFCFDNKSGVEDDGFSQDPNLHHLCDLSLKDYETPSSIEQGYLALSDESSFVSITPSNVSLSDFIFVSDRDNVSPCSEDDDITVVLCLPESIDTENNEDESSFSFVSGCSMTQSFYNSAVDAESDEDNSLFSFVPNNTGHFVDGFDPCDVPSETTRLSYCAAVKMGISEGDGTTPTNPNASPSSRNGRRNNTPTNDSCYNEETTDLWEYIYEGSKLCRGGRPSLQFKGNPRSQKSACGWGTQRRPQWSRKRRKNYKSDRCYYNR